MSTAEEYRQYAKECMEGARTATSDATRKQFLDLAALWLQTAAKLDLGAKPQVDGYDHEPFPYYPPEKPAVPE